METEQNRELFCSRLSRGKAVILTQSSGLSILWLPSPHCHPLSIRHAPQHPESLCLLNLLPDASSASIFLKTMPLHSSEPTWIHLRHLRSLPSPSLVFTELTCVYLSSCPPVFTVPYPQHVRPETPQAGLHTGSLLGTSRGKEEGIWCCTLPPGLNCITHTQSPHSTVSDLRSTHLARCSLECFSEFQSL